MRKYIDIMGQRFGKLVAIDYIGETKNLDTLWICKCDCGKTKEVVASALYYGNTKSCGCRKYGGEHRRLYFVWHTMKRRCEEPTDKSYYLYGAVGIKVCDEWNNFLAFKDWALSHGYDEKAKFGRCTIDRINPYGDYEPNNCRWVSFAEQSRNKRMHHKELALKESEVKENGREKSNPAGSE